MALVVPTTVNDAKKLIARRLAVISTNMVLCDTLLTVSHEYKVEKEPL